MNEASLQVIADRARRLGSIKQHPAWPELREELGRKKARTQKSFQARHFTSSHLAAPVDQREIDFLNGFFAGAEWILDNPEQAEDTLKAALRKSEALEQERR